MIKRHVEQLKIANQQLMKQNNLTLVFNLINRMEPISRVKLSRLTQLSPTTISSLVEELMSDGMIVEIGAGETTSSGRKPIMLKVNQNRGFVVAMELKSGKITGGVYDMKCNRILGSEMPINSITDLGKDLIGFVEDVTSKGGLARENLLGITLGVPGIINFSDFTVVSSTVVEGLHKNKTFYTELNQYYSGIPVTMENESCFAAYAEHTFARNFKEEDNILIDVNEGLGCGIIIQDNIYKGAWGIAGELGHMVIDIHGAPCVCGNRGCLETCVSIPAILQKATHEAKDKGSGIVWGFLQEKGVLTFDQFVMAYEAGDPIATDTAHQAAECLAVGINNVVNLLDIRQITISGEIARLGNRFMDLIKKKIHAMGFELYVEKIEVGYSTLGGNTVELGGARHMLDNIFESKNGFSEQGVGTKKDQAYESF